MVKITNARIDKHIAYHVPIDGLFISSDWLEPVKEYCNIFGLEPEKFESFEIKFKASSKTITIQGMWIGHFRIVLDELSKMGLDLRRVKGMEDRFRIGPK